MTATACVLLRHDVQPRWIGDLLAAYCHTPGCSCGLIVSDPRPDSLPCAEPVTVSPERFTRLRPSGSITQEGLGDSMARIYATFDAEDEVETFDLPSERSGRIVGFRLDGIDVYLTLPRPFDGKDARIAETCDRLIGVLAGLRAAALARAAAPVLRCCGRLDLIRDCVPTECGCACHQDTPLGIEDDVAGEAVAS